MFSCFQGSGSKDDRFGAYLRGDVEKVSELVKKEFLLPTMLVNNSHSRDYNGLLPPCWDGLPLLHVAAMQNKQEIFKVLIGEDKAQQKIYINLKAEIECQKYSGSILHNTLHNNIDIAMIKLLIKYGADCSVKNNHGYSVLSPLLISTHRTRFSFSSESVAIALDELINNGATANEDELHALSAFIFRDFSQPKIKLLSTCIEKKLFLSNLADGSNLLHYLFSQPVKNNEEFKNSYMELIKKLIDNGIDLQAKNLSGYSALHLAVKNETITPKILQILLDKKIDVSCLGPNNQTPLHIAANTETNNTDILKLLLENGADINARDAHNITPLHNAASNEDFTKFLLENGANINDVDDCGSNVAHYAANSKSLEYLLTHNELNFDLKNLADYTPLLKAAEKNNIVNVELLLRKGANPFTCLNYEIPDEHILEIISVYANYNQLEAITTETQPSIPNCIVCPADVEKLKNLIEEPKELAYYFIKYNPDLNVVDEKGRGIVHYAAVSHKLKNILDYKNVLKNVLIDVPDDNGMTPLMYAAFKPGNQDSVALLLKHGANILAKDKCGRGIIFYAMQDKKLLTYLNTYINLQNAWHNSFAKSKLSC